MTAPPAEANLDDLRRRARRRLVGAIVLALAAAVFVPMLLESEPKPLGEDVSVRIPPVDDGKFVNKLGEKGRGEPKAAAAKGDAKADAAKKDGVRAEPAKADAEPSAPAKAEAPAQDAPAVAVAATEPPPPPTPPKRSLEEAEQRVLAAPAKAPASPAPTPAEKASPPPAAPAAAAPAPSAPPAPVAAAPAPARAEGGAAGFSVQLAAFSDDKGANAFANRLKKSGYTAYTEPLETSRGTLWRVRVGPFPSRETAAAVRDKLKAEGHSGIVAAVK